MPPCLATNNLNRSVMSTHARYSVRCDSCNRHEFSQGDDTEMDALLGARHLGWRREKVPNGSMWDFCPTCVQIAAPALINRKP